MVEHPMKWADRAMFPAERHEASDTHGVVPKVFLQWMTPDPLGAMAMATGMYEGKVFRHISEVTDDDRRRSLDNMMSTHLTAGLEVIRFQFLLEGVDRGFTHQDVRQRTAVFFQESLRFAVVEDLMNGSSLPPSLFGTDSTVGHESIPQVAFNDLMRSGLFDNLDTKDQNRAVWDYVMGVIEAGYGFLVNHDMPAEDARGLLPTAVATRIVHNTDLRNLVGHAGNRLCTQAQFHWRVVFSALVKAIREYEPDFSWMGGPDSGFGTSQRTSLIHEWRDKFAWQQEAIANSGMFKPACYQLGHCPFKADFDRACKIRGRVDIRASVGSDPKDWHKPMLGTRWDENYRDNGIADEEWLLDPAAARMA